MLNKKILLINLPPFSRYNYCNAGTVYPATGLMIVGTILKQRGRNVQFIDGALDADYEEQVIRSLSDEVLFVGFSLMTSQLRMAYSLATKIKARDSYVPIVFGGMHPTLYPEQTAGEAYVDIVAINEGTQTVVELLDHFEQRKPLKDIKGIAYRDDKGRVILNSPQQLDDIETLPHFDFSLLNLPRYLETENYLSREFDLAPGEKIQLMPILTGLGCCYRCNFCVNVILKRRYRYRSTISIVNEIKRLQKSYGVNAFWFLDEDFFINRKRLEELIELVKKEKLTFIARTWSRVSYFSNDAYKNVLSCLEKIGIRSIAMGAESGSQRMLDYICKGIKVEEIPAAVQYLSQTNIMPRLSFMVGLDTEEKADVIATYRLCAELMKCNARTDIAGPYIYRYYPGSPMFNTLVKKHNIQIPNRIKDWDAMLDDDGSLKIEGQRYCWSGFLKYTEAMNTYIIICCEVLRQSRFKGKAWVKLLRNLMIWRLTHSSHLYTIDYYLLRILKGIRIIMKKMKRWKASQFNGLFQNGAKEH